MKEIKLLIALLLILTAIAGCNAFKGRPESDDIDQARGSNVWYDRRMTEEMNAAQTSENFGEVSDDNYNDEEPLGINNDRPIPFLNK